MLGELKREVEAGAIVAVSTPLGRRVAWEELVAVMMRFNHECPAARDRCLTPQTSKSAGSDMNVTAVTHRCPGAQTRMSPVQP